MEGKKLSALAWDPSSEQLPSPEAPAVQPYSTLLGLPTVVVERQLLSGIYIPDAL